MIKVLKMMNLYGVGKVIMNPEYYHTKYNNKIK